MKDAQCKSQNHQQSRSDENDTRSCHSMDSLELRSLQVDGCPPKKQGVVHDRILMSRGYIHQQKKVEQERNQPHWYQRLRDHGSSTTLSQEQSQRQMNCAQFAQITRSKARTQSTRERRNQLSCGSQANLIQEAHEYENSTHNLITFP